MAYYLLRVLLERTGGQNRDRVVWGFHVDSPAPVQVGALEASFDAAWNPGVGTTIGSMIQTAYEVDRFQVYDASAGGPPTDEALATPGKFVTTGAAGPQEVQVCITRWTNDSLGRPRKQGRWYVGPISGTEMNQDRPTLALRNVFGLFQRRFHHQLAIRGHQPVVLRRTPTLITGFPIVQYSIDDAWDTQRRRGIDPGSEEIYPPTNPPAA